MGDWRLQLAVCAVSITLAACGRTNPVPDDTTGAGPEAAPARPAATSPAGAPEPVLAQLREAYADLGGDTWYFAAAFDLNGDGGDEVIVHVVGPMVCGTGGCDTLVFTPTGSGYEQLGDISITRPPIRVSSQSSNGWRNLIVHISGGGVGAAFDGEVPFDGTAYQPNPTSPMVDPATDLDDAIIVIPEFESLADGEPLVTE